MVREVVTLQLGELSNYVATHFWNTQVRKTSSGIWLGRGTHIPAMLTTRLTRPTL